MAAKPYADWKIIAWRFIRTFVAVLLVQLGTGLTAIGRLEDVWPHLLLPSLSAAVVALGKAIREWVASEDYTNLIHKLPV